MKSLREYLYTILCEEMEHDESLLFTEGGRIMDTQRIARLKEWFLNSQAYLFDILISFLEEQEKKEDGNE